VKGTDRLIHPRDAALDSAEWQDWPAARTAGLSQTAGIEQAAAVTASMFLDGGRRRP
jgi:hypothetical protein